MEAFFQNAGDAARWRTAIGKAVVDTGTVPLTGATGATGAPASFMTTATPPTFTEGIIGATISPYPLPPADAKTDT